jgi:hypothetical protein
MIAPRTLIALLALAAIQAPLNGQSTGTISLHKRLHINTLITEPGTMEVDWASLYSISTGNFTMPLAVKYTPEGRHVIWGRTEYSLAFDSLDSADIGGERLTQFSQSMSVTATSVLHDGPKLDFAIAPQAVFFLRDESGARLGATGIARYDSGHSSVGATVGWSAATHSSPTNPAGVLDVGFGFGQNISGSDTAEKFTPHCNVVWEHATGIEAVLSVFEGVEYQMTGRIAFDLSAQHFAVNTRTADHQIVIGVTVNFGKQKR